MRRPLGPLVSWLALALLAWPVAGPAQAPRAERPTLAIGEKWIRDDGTWQLTRIEDEKYVFTADRRQIHLTRDLAFARFQTGQRIELEFHPPPPIPWPLEVGKRWVGSGLVIGPPEEGSAPSRLDLKVDQYGEIKVGAQTVKAFRITLQIESAGVRLGEIRAWYAPEARQLVKAEGRESGHYSHGGTPPSINLRFLGFQVTAVEPPPAAAPVVAAPAPPSPPPAATPAPPPPPAPATPPPAATPAPTAPPPVRPGQTARPAPGRPAPGARPAPAPPGAAAPAPAPPPPAAVPAPPPPPTGGGVARSQFTYKVTYRVLGSAGAAALTYRNVQGGTEQTRVRLPWEISFDAKGGSFLYVSAQNPGVEGSVTCEIALDDEVRTRSTSTGAYVIAECSNAAEKSP
jgi:hypothetical protein